MWLVGGLDNQIINTAEMLISSHRVKIPIYGQSVYAPIKKNFSLRDRLGNKRQVYLTFISDLSSLLIYLVMAMGKTSPLS